MFKEPGGKTENFAITTDAQWQLELPSLLVDEKASELNGYRMVAF